MHGDVEQEDNLNITGLQTSEPQFTQAICAEGGHLYLWFGFLPFYSGVVLAQQERMSTPRGLSESSSSSSSVPSSPECGTHAQSSFRDKPKHHIKKVWFDKGVKVETAASVDGPASIGS